MDDLKRIIDRQRELFGWVDELISPTREIMKQFEGLDSASKAIRDSLAQQEEFAATLRDLTPPLDDLGLTTEMRSLFREHMPTATSALAPQDLPRLNFDPPPPPEPGPAAKTLQVIKRKLEAKKREVEDQRHAVAMLVTLMDETQLMAEQLWNEGDHVICVDGKDIKTGDRREVNVGVEMFQFEFVVVEVPPRKPNLRPVN